jgi:hypothetical protein
MYSPLTLRASRDAFAALWPSWGWRSTSADKMAESTRITPTCRVSLLNSPLSMRAAYLWTIGHVCADALLENPRVAAGSLFREPSCWSREPVAAGSLHLAFHVLHVYLAVHQRVCIRVIRPGWKKKNKTKVRKKKNSRVSKPSRF